MNLLGKMIWVNLPLALDGHKCKSHQHRSPFKHQSFIRKVVKISSLQTNHNLSPTCLTSSSGSLASSPMTTALESGP